MAASLPPRESQVLAACLSWLHLKGFFVWRNNTGAYVAGEGSDRRRIRYGLKGSADIIGMFPSGSRCGDGRFLAVECKAGKNDLSTHQEQFRDRVRRCGGVHVTVWSVDDLARELEPML